MLEYNTWGYLGPSGTFTESALRSVHSGHAAKAFTSAINALDALEAKTCDAVVLPVENSVEGGSSDTIRILASRDLRIVGEATLPITFVLAVPPGLTPDEVTQIASHPLAYSHCQQWLSDRLPHATFVPTSSTASAAAIISRRAPEGHRSGALCSPAAAATHGLDIAIAGISDDPSAHSRYIVATHDHTIPASTTSDKTTLVIHDHASHAGSLVKVLSEFASRDINLVRLESRHRTQNSQGVSFVVDVHGHIHEPRLQEALKALHRQGLDVHFVGSYATTDQYPAPGAGHSEKDYLAANTWMNNILQAAGGVKNN